MENLNTIGDIESIVDEFPYFQTARLLLLKKQCNSEDVHFAQELKKTAIYAGNRKILYYLILYKAFTEKLIEIDKSISDEDTVPENIVTTNKEDEDSSNEQSAPSTLDRQIIEQAVAYSIEKDVLEISAKESISKDSLALPEIVEIDISNLSFTESWLDKSIDVFNTAFAFFENHKVSTIIKPAANNNKLGVGTFLDITSMLKSVAGTPEATHAS